MAVLASCDRVSVRVDGFTGCAPLTSPRRTAPTTVPERSIATETETRPVGVLAGVEIAVNVSEITGCDAHAAPEAATA
jgi:hypothetical protein